MHQQFLDPELSGFIHNLRATLPYLEEFYQQIFVIQISDELLDLRTSRVIEDLALLHQVGIRIVLVHSAHARIKKNLAANGYDFQMEEGVFVASESQMPLIEQAIASVNWQFLNQLRSCGRQLKISTGHFLFSEQRNLSNNNFPHYSGIVSDVETENLRQEISASKLIIIPPFSLGEKGRLWILDPNQVAYELATRLRAKKMIVLDTQTLPVFDGTETKKLGEMTTDGIHHWIKQQSNLHEKLVIKLNNLAEACEHGVERCHLLDGKIEGVLLAELLTPKGAGVMITNSSYKRTRPAHLSDIQSILDILNMPFEHAAVVLRTPAYMEQNIDNYMVFCVDEDVVGCCEIIDYTKESASEIASLAVDPAYRNQGLGRDMIHSALDLIREKNHSLAFALSTGTAHVFQQCGFRQISPDQLPKDKCRNYDFQETLVYGRSL